MVIAQKQEESPLQSPVRCAPILLNGAGALVVGPHADLLAVVSPLAAAGTAVRTQMAALAVDRALPLSGGAHDGRMSLGLPGTAHIRRRSMNEQAVDGIIRGPAQTLAPAPLILQHDAPG
jgi:hypothetical protein